MPKPGFSDISVVLDRSGSMESIAEDTIGSFNAFLKDQQKIDAVPDLATVQKAIYVKGLPDVLG